MDILRKEHRAADSENQQRKHKMASTRKDYETLLETTHAAAAYKPGGPAATSITAKLKLLAQGAELFPRVPVH